MEAEKRGRGYNENFFKEVIILWCSKAYKENRVKSHQNLEALLLLVENRRLSIVEEVFQQGHNVLMGPNML